MGYVLGVSSGAFGVAGGEEKPQLAGLFRKAQTSITKGVNFVQLDLESISEFEEPDLRDNMKKNIKEKLGIDFGVHSETRAFGVEAAELDSAISMDYQRAQERIVTILEKSKDIGSKYVLIHSSESEPFRLLERALQSCDLVDFNGGKLSKFLEDNRWLVDWVFTGREDGKDEEVVGCAFNAWISEGRDLKSGHIVSRFNEKNIIPKDFIFVEVWGGQTLAETLRSRIEGVVEELEIYRGGKKYDTLSEKDKNDANDRIRASLEAQLRNLRSYLIQFVQSRSLHYGPERLAYFMIARWMEKNRDPLWGKIVNANIKFFAKREGKSAEEWMISKGLDSARLSIDHEKFREMNELWVPAVSAKYIYGHLFPTVYEDPKKYLDGMIFALESPMGGRGTEEWLRLGNPYVYYFLVEEANLRAGKEIFTVAMDFEHMLSLRLDPKTVIELLPEGAGRVVRVIHAGWPSTLAPAHMPIEIGSTQQKYLYEMYFKLREKGFGRDNKDYFIVFERGGPETFQQSIVSLKLIIEFLEKDTPPDKLPMEFFGLATGAMASVERQMVNIREHAYDPLRGMISVPEEEHGFLGRAAVEKGKAEEWRKEKLR